MIITAVRRLIPQETARIRFLVLGVALGLSVGIACGDDDSGNHNTGSDAAVDATSDGSTGESLTLRVVDGDYLTPEEPAIPIEGATVAFDLPGGAGRVEVLSDADGLATVHGVDWSAGTLSYTVFKFGFSLLSVTRADLDFLLQPGFATDGVPMAGLIRVDPEDLDMSMVRGTTTNLVDETHNVYLQVLRTRAAEESYNVGTAVWSLRIQNGVPFTIVGFEGIYEALPSGQGATFEMFQALTQDFDALTGNVSGVELDFLAREATLHTVDASMFLPTRTDSPLRNGSPMSLVQAEGSVGSLGLYEYMDISADGDYFDLTLSWVEPSLVEGVWTRYNVTDNATGAWSFAREEGYPQGGTLDPPLLDTPRILVPSSLTQGHPLHSGIEFERFDSTSETVGLYVYAGDKLVWRLFTPPTETSITVPQATSNVNEAAMLGSDATAQVLTGYSDAANPYYFSRMAISPRFVVEP